ncbi:16S rRNA (cytosine(967)-C(5))-methyltransferase RsmB [Motilimonas pumila]|uniref:16S rRNA (cytosine(967)-C(5))-methyltransferase n=1 Tax=Motilimonas pumila TaxID=2303987 RepID=A0A418YJ30_9GAMM|nr:16S rRNA (cytosine(967)-C(5))-methyltransferase RsmB [Motilimonas pumila]RJG50661.1 16S rRNA (cytosine(967)-C(5))-methyltransferase RsmB [Motilimonas pumila]
MANQNVRGTAAIVLNKVVEQGESLNTALPAAQQLVAPKDKALLQELCYGVLRWLPRLDFFAKQLMDKPLTGKKRPLHFLVLVGIYQILYTRIPAHAAVADTVNGIKTLKAPGLKGLVNAVLRNFQRQQDELIAAASDKPSLVFCHPNWLIKRLQHDYPAQYEAILAAANERSPMWLRVNQQRHSTAEYQALLAEQDIVSDVSAISPHALMLEKPTDVSKLPSFMQGDASVQDAAAQMAASLLAPQANERILDACAAPGGKTAHLLEIQPGISHLTAVDFDAKRLERVQQNLDRIGLHAELIHGDASQPNDWWDQQLFDRILLDAPCSATGVIRRHPDIKWLRRDSDIIELSKLQQAILQANWQLLKPGGTLLYATCSVLAIENVEQIRAFLAATPDASLVPINSEDTPEHPGWQILPGQDNMDGFYYARLRKSL